MAIVSRRSVLRSLAKTSALAAAAPLFSAIPGCSHHGCYEDCSLTLNVVLHGLFVLHFRDKDLELLTPDVHDHIYRAGNWDINEVCPLYKGQEYSLCGVIANPDPPALPRNCNVFFSQRDYNFKLRPERSVFKVWLPFPDDFKLLRCSPDSDLYSGELPRCRKEEGVKIVDKLSLCQVLIYRVKDYRSLALPGTRWKPKINHNTGTANLHLWAEPADRLSPCHAEDAYRRLDDLLDTLHLRLGFYSTVPLDSDTGVKGLPPEEEQGWSDWASGGGEGAYPTNCCLVMVR